MKVKTSMKAGGVAMNLTETVHSGHPKRRLLGLGAGRILAFVLVIASPASLPATHTPGPLRLTPAGDRVFFTARKVGLGRELWVSDGTPAGTGVVKDIRPGVRGSGWGFFSNNVIDPLGRDGPLFLTPAGGTLFFAANDGTFGGELWKSDGTDDGTVMVKDFIPGDAHPDFDIRLQSEWVDVEGTLFLAFLATPAFANSPATPRKFFHPPEFSTGRARSSRPWVRIRQRTDVQTPGGADRVSASPYVPRGALPGRVPSHRVTD